MKKYIFVACAVVMFVSFAKSQTINNFEKPTDSHIQVSGTNVFLVPPTNFLLSQNFKGFQNPDDLNSMIMITEIPSAPVSEILQSFTKKNLKEKAMDLISKKEIKIAGYEGVLIYLEQTVNEVTFSKDILIYGDKTFTMLVNGVYLKENIELGKQIKESILSTVINKNLEVSPRESLSFEVDETVGELKFKTAIGNAMLLNRDLKTPTESKDKATLIIDKSYMQTDIEDPTLFCISRLKKYPSTISLKFKYLCL